MNHSKWQSLIMYGNECFHNQQLKQAEKYYWQAYDVLSFDCINNPNSSDLLMAWVCCCHNLSSLYETIGDFEMSFKFLMVPHEYLLTVANTENRSDDIRTTAINGTRLTTPPILLFTQNHYICDECQSKFPSLSQIFEQNESAVQFH